MVDKTPPNERGARAEFHVDETPRDVDPAIFEALVDRRRRYVLFSLLDTSDGVAELDDLAEQVRRWERAADGADPEAHRDRVLASLYHVDVPRLADAGLVEFDPRSKTVRYRGDEDQERVLQLITRANSE